MKLNDKKSSPSTTQGLEIVQVSSMTSQDRDRNLFKETLHLKFATNHITSHQIHIQLFLFAKITRLLYVVEIDS